jgi:hypothetical protein
MKRIAGVLAAALIAGWAGGAAAEDPSIEQLPRDVGNAATIWTEPLKSVAEQSRRRDPVSGLWFGLLEGSVRSVERTVNLIRDRESAHPQRDAGKIFRYQF